MISTDAISRALKNKDYNMALILLEQLKVETSNFTIENQNQHLICLYSLDRNLELLQYSQAYMDSGNVTNDLIYLTALANFKLKNWNTASQLFSRNPSWRRWIVKCELCSRIERGIENAIKVQIKNVEHISSQQNESDLLEPSPQVASGSTSNDKFTSNNDLTSKEDQLNSQSKTTEISPQLSNLPESEGKVVSKTPEQNEAERLEQDISEKTAEIIEQNNLINWTQSSKQITISIPIEGITKDQIHISCLQCAIDIDFFIGTPFHMERSIELYKKVIPETIKFQVSSNELVVTVNKEKEETWARLEHTEADILSELDAAAALDQIMSIPNISDTEAAQAFEEIQTDVMENPRKFTYARY